MWWTDLGSVDLAVPMGRATVDPLARVHPTALLTGDVRVGPRTVICAGAYIEGPVSIGSDCLVGNNAMIRGATWIGSRTRLGFAVEVKGAHIGQDVSIGPQSFVADSRIDDHAYLAAQVRTSNQRLDRKNVRVMHEGMLIDSGRDKLGCHIGARASLGVQVIVLPGRVVAADALFEPRITICRNMPTGRYRVAQTLENY